METCSADLLLFGIHMYTHTNITSTIPNTPLSVSLIFTAVCGYYCFVLIQHYFLSVAGERERPTQQQSHLSASYYPSCIATTLFIPYKSGKQCRLTHVALQWSKTNTDWTGLGAMIKKKKKVTRIRQTNANPTIFGSQLQWSQVLKAGSIISLKNI